MSNRNWQRAGCFSAAIVAVVLLVSGPLVSRHLHMKDWEALDATKPGDSLGDLVENFGRKPDIEVNYGDCRVFYYKGRKGIVLSCLHPEEERAVPASVDDWSDIPFIYDAKQVLVDSGGEIKAITWNGETYTVETAWGPISGSDVKVLGERLPSCCGLAVEE